MRSDNSAIDKKPQALTPESSPVSSEPRAPSPELVASRPEPSAPSPEPRISIVTPSYNQGKFLEKTILSVLGQGYPNLEYIIIDGGSTDESVEIIRKYADRLTYWVSEPDRGQSHAINKGFERATGEIFGWLNSDDWYHPGALQAVAEAFALNPEAGAVVGAGEMLYQESGSTLLMEPFEVTIESLCRSVYGRYFMQPSCFFTGSAWHDCGPLDLSLHLAMDTDLWLSIARKYPFATISNNLSVTLVHQDAKTSALAAESYSDGIMVILKHGEGQFAREQLVKLLNDLLQEQGYYHELLKKYSALTDEYTKLHAEHGNLYAEYTKLNQVRLGENEQWQNAIDRVYSSFSWRLTAPLRRIHKLFTGKGAS